MSLSEAMELSLQLLFSPAATLSRLRQSEVPGYGVLLFQVLFWTGVGNVLAAVLVMMNTPAIATGPLPLLVFLFSAAAVLVPASFLGAALVHLLSKFSGGKSGFARSYQVLASLAVLAPVAAGAFWAPVPYAWVLPSVWATVLCVKGVEIVTEAPAAQAWAVVGVFGGLMAVGQVLIHEKAAAVAHNMENMAAFYGMAKSSPEAAPISREWAVAAQNSQAAELPPNAQAAMAQVQSSLQGFAPSAGQAPGTPQNAEQARAIGLKMLDQANQQFAANQAALQKMSPQQRAQVMQLMQMANQMGERMRQGKTAVEPGQMPQFPAQQPQPSRRQTPAGAADPDKPVAFE